MRGGIPRGGETGFTLVELLVTLSLLSLLTLVLFGGLRFGVRAWEGVQAHGGGDDEVRVVQNSLRQLIERAYPAADRSDPEHAVVEFSGDENSVTLLAPAPDAVGGSGRSWITLTAARDGRDSTLLIRTAPELSGSPRQSLSSPLLRHIAAIRIAYFSNGRWTTSWHGASTLPELVRLRVAFGPNDGRVWPDLIVAPRITGDAACAISANPSRCASGS